MQSNSTDSDWVWPKAGWITREEMLQIPAQETSQSSHLCSSPSVSVLMMTRNHQDYLEQAVQSVISQDIDEPFEILIGEDFSSDETLAVALELQRRHPDVIRVISAPRNVGITSNFLRLVAHARAPYLALLEGDDYWIHPSKLTLQLAQLRTYPQAALSAAATANRTPCLPVKEFYDLNDILSRYVVHTSSLLIRAEHIHSYPRFPDIIGWITMLMGYLLARGDCAYLDTTVSFYRRHEGGLWHNADRLNRLDKSRQCIDVLDSYFFHRFTQELSDRELWIYGMDFVLPQRNCRRHWFQSWNILIAQSPRLLCRVPLGFCMLVLRLLLQPLWYSVMIFRRKVALRSRLRAMAE